MATKYCEFKERNKTLAKRRQQNVEQNVEQNVAKRWTPIQIT